MKKKLKEDLIKEGTTPEMIMELEEYFHKERQRIYRNRKTREKLGITVSSLSAYVDENGEEFEVYSAMSKAQLHEYLSMEEYRIQQEMIIREIDDCLSEMPYEESRFLYRLACGTRGIETQMAQEYGLTRPQFRHKKKLLEKKLRKIYERKYGNFFSQN